MLAGLAYLGSAGKELYKILRIVGLTLSMAVLFGAAAKLPPLPTTGFIKGRVAHKSDLAHHSAVFVLDGGADDMTISTPVQMTIPQYGYYSEGKVAVFIVQAERMKGQTFIGARTFSGGTIVGFLGDFELWGKRPRR